MDLRILTIFLFFLPAGLCAQTFFGDTLRWSINLNVKSSHLGLSALNDQLNGMGNLNFEDNTEEVNFYVNAKTESYPVGLSLSSSRGGSSTFASDRSTYSDLRVNYLGIGIFADLDYKRLSLRGLVIYELGRYRGDYYVKSISGGAVSGNTILNQTTGLKPTLQLMYNLGKNKRLGIGAEWSYFYYLSQTGWEFYLSGNPANLPDLANGENAFSFVLRYRFDNN